MYVLLLVLSYLFGSIPFALIIGKVFKNIDIREYGSGNIGSTNAARVLGYKLGLLTLIFDVFKGMLFVFIAIKIGLSPFEISTIGGVSILGHCYSIYLNFTGGKAVATSLGVFIILIPKTIILSAVLFLLIFLIFKYVSVASIISAISVPIYTYILYNIKEYVIFSTIVAIIIILRHKSNILNLINGKEERFFEKAKKK